jgi:hypothetical protein
MKKIQLTILLAAAVLLAVCSFTSLRLQQTVHGSGVFGREERPASGIERVKMSGFGELIISQGDRETLTIEGDDNLLPNFITETNAGTLSIHERLFFSFKPSQPVVFHLTVKNLKALDLSDFVRVTVKNLDAVHLSVSLSGFSQLSFDNLQTGELDGQLKGFSSLTVDGRVLNERVISRENATYQTAKN